MPIVLSCPTPADVRAQCPRLSAGRSDAELDDFARRLYAIARVIWENAGLLPKTSAL